MHYLQTHGKFDNAAVILETIEEPKEAQSMHAIQDNTKNARGFSQRRI